MPSENLNNASTTEYSVTRSYNTASGLMQIPVNGGQSRVVRLCNDVQQMIISFTATREGGPPTAPSPLSFKNEDGQNVQLISSSVSVPIPVQIGPGMGHGWQIAGTYVYALKVPIDYESPIPTGTYPWGMSGFTTNPELNLDDLYFNRGILCKHSTVPTIPIDIPIDPNP